MKHWSAFNWIFLCIRFRIEKFSNEILFLWKKKLNCPFIFFFLEAIYKLKPILGYNLFIVKKKNRKKLIKIHPFLLNERMRTNRAIFWLCRAIKLRVEFSFTLKVLCEIFSINFLHTSLALLQKIKSYTIISVNKTSKNYLW